MSPMRVTPLPAMHRLAIHLSGDQYTWQEGSRDGRKMSHLTGRKGSPRVLRPACPSPSRSWMETAGSPSAPQGAPLIPTASHPAVVTEPKETPAGPLTEVRWGKPGPPQLSVAPCLFPSLAPSPPSAPNLPSPSSQVQTLLIAKANAHSLERRAGEVSGQVHPTTQQTAAQAVGYTSQKGCVMSLCTLGASSALKARLKSRPCTTKLRASTQFDGL
jgi:hypothetical protein